MTTYDGRPAAFEGFPETNSWSLGPMSYLNERPQKSSKDLQQQTQLPYAAMFFYPSTQADQPPSRS